MSRREINDDMLVYENGKYKAFAMYDFNAENPFDSWDMLGRFAFKRKVGYIVCKNVENLPDYLYKEVVDDDGFGDEVDCDLVEYMQLYHDAFMVIPLTYYGEMRECDENEAQGCIYISNEKYKHEYGDDKSPERIARVLECLRSEIQLHNDWGSGEVYGWAIFDMSEVEDAEDLDMIDHIDSCWGYYGGYPHKESGLYESAKEQVDWLVKQDMDAYTQATHFPAWKFEAFVASPESFK